MGRFFDAGGRANVGSFAGRARPMRWFLRSLLGRLLALGIIVAAIGIGNYAPLAISHPEQDDCTFGPVTNEQYRAYLADVRSKQRSTWKGFTGGPRQITSELNARLTDLLSPEDSVYVRLAKMHAVMRGIGAEFKNTNGRAADDPYGSGDQRRGSVTFNYEVDINRLVVFQLYPRTLWIPAILADPVTTRREILEKYGRLSFVANLVSVLDPAPQNVLLNSGRLCPPVPSSAAATRFDSHQ